MCRKKNKGLYFRKQLRNIFKDITEDDFFCPFNKKWDMSLTPEELSKCKFSTCVSCSSPSQCIIFGLDCPNPFNLKCERNPENKS